MERFVGIDPGLTTGVAEVLFKVPAKGEAEVHAVALSEIKEVRQILEILEEPQTSENGVWVEASPVLASNAKVVVQQVEGAIAAVAHVRQVRPAAWKPDKRVAAVVEILAPGLPKSHARDALSIAAYGMLEEGYSHVYNAS